MKEKPKTNEKHLYTVVLTFLVFCILAILMNMQRDIGAEQYNELIQYHQEEGRNIWSDGDYVMIRK